MHEFWREHLEAHDAPVPHRMVARTASNGESLLLVVTGPQLWRPLQAFARFVMQNVPSLRGVLHESEQGRKTRVTTIEGRDWLEEEVNDLRLRVTGAGFFQVNTFLTPTLVETALNFADAQPENRALDVFCGVGLFALSLARRGAAVLGLEANPHAVQDAIFNAAQNGLQAEFKAGDAAKTLHHLKPEWNIALLDPPREGAAACLAPLARLRPRRIVYVSCDPATLARDVKALARSGYHLRAAVPLDLFPQTAHVETVACLEL